MASNTDKTTVRIDRETMQRVKMLAVQTGRNYTDTVELAIKAYLAQQEAPLKKGPKGHERT